MLITVTDSEGNKVLVNAEQIRYVTTQGLVKGYIKLVFSESHYLKVKMTLQEYANAYNNEYDPFSAEDEA